MGSCCGDSRDASDGANCADANGGRGGGASSGGGRLLTLLRLPAVLAALTPTLSLSRSLSLTLTLTLSLSLTPTPSLSPSPSRCSPRWPCRPPSS